MQDKIFYVIGAGPTFLDITNEEWEFLKDKETITYARTLMSGKKFKYFQSLERYETLDKDIIDFLYESNNMDIKLFLSIKESQNYAKEKGFKIQRLIKGNFYFQPSRMPWFLDEVEPPNTFDETLAHTFRQPIFRYRGGLSAVINTVMILGATEIRLAGVDFLNQWCFYDDIPYFRKICKNERLINKYVDFIEEQKKNRLLTKYELNKDFDPLKMHTTDMPMQERDKYGERWERGMSDVLQWLDKEWRLRGGKGIFITNKRSKLYLNNKLKYKSIMEE